MTMPNENGSDVKQLTRDEAQKFCSQLCEVLIDSVNGGASMGFLPPLSAVEASVYWQGVGDHIGTGCRGSYRKRKPDLVCGSWKRGNFRNRTT